MLAKEVEHTIDVDGMLDRMSPSLWAEWCIMYKIWAEQAKSGDENPTSFSDSLNAMRAQAGV